MTRQEVTNTRDLRFSGWIRTNLPDSATGFMVSDIDFLLFNFKTNIWIMLEIKTRSAKLRHWQREMYNNLDEIISAGVNALGNKIEWRGVHVVTFENTFFDDGKCYLDDHEISEEELKYYLSCNF